MISYLPVTISCLASFGIARAYFHSFFRSRRIAPAAAAAVRGGVFCAALMLAGHCGSRSLPAFFLYSLILALGGALLYRGHFLNIAFFATLGNTVAVLVEILSSLLLSRRADPGGGAALAASALSGALLLLLIILPASHMERALVCAPPLLRWLPLFTIPVASVALISLLFHATGPTSPSLFPASLLLLAINLSAFAVYAQLSSSAGTEKASAEHMRQLESALGRPGSAQGAAWEMQKARHDFKNRLLYLQELAESQDNREISRYISHCLGRDIPGPTAVDTGNSLFDRILNGKMGTALSMGIDFKPSLEVPQGLSLDGETLCVVLGNALDNAIEAAAAVPGPGYVDVLARYRKGCLEIRIRNPFAHGVEYGSGGRLCSTKREPGRHGIGLSSMRDALERVHGDMDIEADEEKGVFTIRILLYEE